MKLRILLITSVYLTLVSLTVSLDYPDMTGFAEVEDFPRDVFLSSLKQLFDYKQEYSSMEQDLISFWKNLSDEQYTIFAYNLSKLILSEIDPKNEIVKRNILNNMIKIVKTNLNPKLEIFAVPNQNIFMAERNKRAFFNSEITAKRDDQNCHKVQKTN